MIMATYGKHAGRGFLLPQGPIKLAAPMHGGSIMSPPGKWR